MPFPPGCKGKMLANVMPESLANAQAEQEIRPRRFNREGMRVEDAGFEAWGGFPEGPLERECLNEDFAC